jgi:hypothetical protein
VLQNSKLAFSAVPSFEMRHAVRNHCLAKVQKVAQRGGGIKMTVGLREIEIDPSPSWKHCFWRVTGKMLMGFAEPTIRTEESRRKW